MKILLVAAEVAPIVKLGGLGDVIGSLPKALEKLGTNVDVIAPFFPFAKIDNIKLYKSIEINVPYGGENYLVNVYNTKLPDSNVDVILLQNSRFFGGHSGTWKLSNEQELESFSFFDRSVVEFIKSKFNTYDLIHCNDWHTGLISHILEDELSATRPATLFTVHNLMYQGVGEPVIARNVGIVPGVHALIDWDIADGDLNLVQQGVTSSDYINTVSLTYSKEILTPEYGGGLHEILQAREGRLTGILNGLDYSLFPRGYSSTNWKTKKPEYKKKLAEKLNLSQSTNKPIFAFVGRLDSYQKGLDLTYGAIPHIIEKGGQFILLGDGDEAWKQKFVEMSQNKTYVQDFSAQLKFDLELAKMVYAGSDFLIVPSKYEPCGLIQMIAMWYGSLPIVRATGGLKDSVKEGFNGFLFDKYDVGDLNGAIDKAFLVYGGKEMQEMIFRAISEDFSWEKSAMQYNELYKKIIQLRLENI